MTRLVTDVLTIQAIDWLINFLPEHVCRNVYLYRRYILGHLLTESCTPKPVNWVKGNDLVSIYQFSLLWIFCAIARFLGNFMQIPFLLSCWWKISSATNARPKQLNFMQICRYWYAIINYFADSAFISCTGKISGK